MSLPHGTILEPMPEAEQNPYDTLVRDLKGLLGAAPAEYETGRYDVVLSLAMLGIAWVKERNNQLMSRQAIQSMMERYSVSPVGAVDYVVVRAERVMDEKDGQAEVVNGLWRAKVPKNDMPEPLTPPEGLSDGNNEPDPALQDTPNPDDTEPPKPGEELKASASKKSKR